MSSDLEKLKAKMAIVRAALVVIAELPMPEQDDMLSANMRQLAISALAVIDEPAQ